MSRRRDPIVEEVRKHRAAIAREHGNRLDSILAAFRREEASWPAGTVSRQPKRRHTGIVAEDHHSSAHQAAAPDSRAPKALNGCR